MSVCALINIDWQFSDGATDYTSPVVPP